MQTTSSSPHSPSIRRFARLAAAGAGSGLFLLTAGALPALAVTAGNNGTIKVDGVEFDSHPDNQPHVGCTFEVDFYGYDLGDYDAEVTFEAQAPTGDGVLLTDTVFIGEDDSSGAATPEGLDAHVEYDLTSVLAGFEPQPQQGYHVSLTINAEYAQGADVKHKTFWVEGCEQPADEEVPPVVEEPPATPEEPPAVPEAPPAEVLGVTITRAADPADPGAASLPRTGAGTGLLAAAGTSLVALGVATRRLGVRLAGR